MKRSVFAPLAKELLRAAGHPVLDFASLATCGEGGEENPGAGHSLVSGYHGGWRGTAVVTALTCLARIPMYLLPILSLPQKQREASRMT